jgi:hypothetical protein
VLYPLFEWMEAQAVYGASPYIGPINNLFHLLSMVCLVGALLIVDLRLLGLGLKHQPVSVVARDARPWLILGGIGILLTGIPQLMERATDQYANSVFWMKMWVLTFGVIWWAVVRPRVTKRDDNSGAFPKVVALVSIAVWVFVASSARLIMLLPADFFFDVGLYK